MRTRASNAGPLSREERIKLEGKLRSDAVRKFGAKPAPLNPGTLLSTAAVASGLPPPSHADRAEREQEIASRRKVCVCASMPSVCPHGVRATPERGHPGVADAINLDFNKFATHD